MTMVQERPALAGEESKAVHRTIAQLTARQQEVLDYVREFIDSEGLAPTVQEIQRQFGFKSPNAAQSHLRALQSEGAIVRRGHRARALRIVGNGRGPAHTDIETARPASDSRTNGERPTSTSVQEPTGSVAEFILREFGQPAPLYREVPEADHPNAEKSGSGAFGWLRRVKGRAQAVVNLEDVSDRSVASAGIAESIEAATSHPSVEVQEGHSEPSAESLALGAEQGTQDLRPIAKVSEMGLDVFFNAEHMTSEELNGEIHAHSWRLRVVVRTGRGQNEPTMGLEQIRQVLQNVVTPVDGSVLNSRTQFKVFEPTLERVAGWLGHEIKGALKKVNLELVSTTLWDQPTQYLTTWELEPYRAA